MKIEKRHNYWALLTGYGLLPAAGYLTLLGDRLDYCGHYLAGFGGTLLVLSLVASRYDSRTVADLQGVSLLIVVACIGLGAIEEATTFRLAKFDEVDFFNQSIGAILAGLFLIVWRSDRESASYPTSAGILSSFGLIAAGFILAFS